MSLENLNVTTDLPVTVTDASTQATPTPDTESNSVESPNTLKKSNPDSVEHQYENVIVVVPAGTTTVMSVVP